MRDGRFATPRFNAAVDVAHVQKPGAKLLGESAERKKDFSEISAYRNSITRRGNRRHAAEQSDELAPVQLIELHSVPVSQGRIAGYRISDGQSGGNRTILQPARSLAVVNHILGDNLRIK